MPHKLTETFVIDACRQMHPESADVEAVMLESLKYRKMALLKAKNNVNNQEDVDMFYFLKKIKDSLLEEEIQKAYETRN